MDDFNLADADLIFKQVLEELNNNTNKSTTNSGGNCTNEPNIAMSIFVILIVIIGLFGNAIVFFVILVLKEYKKSVSNWYVLQLAMADTLFLLMLPFTASELMAGKWDFPLGVCKAKEGILYVNYYASILFLTMMSFDRYMAVTRSGVSPWADVLRRLDSAALISLIIWIISIVLAVPLYLFSKVNSCNQCSYEFPSSDRERCMKAFINETACAGWIKIEDGVYFNEDDVDDETAFSEKNLNTLTASSSLSGLVNDIEEENKGICSDKAPTETYRIWLYINFSCLLVLPFILICGFYGMILRTMMGTTATASTSQRQYRRRVTLMVLALVTLFAFSWVPWYAVMLARIPGFYLHKDGCTQLFDFIRIMSYLNSALNPYFYSFMGSKFHQRFRRAQTTATRRSRFFHFLSRVSWSGHDSNSHSGGACNGRRESGRDIQMRNVNGNSESFDTRSNLRTERTMIDPPQTDNTTA